MVLSADADAGIKQRYQQLCVGLNMDKESTDEAWNSYESIRHNYTLEADQLHWLGCALYVACRKTLPAVGRTGASVEGNCVSLTRLLRLCKLSLIQFFNKSKKWADMASLPPAFRGKIDRLERNFAVSMVIFKKFQPIFIDMFKNPADDQPKLPRRKNRGAQCTPSKVFDFCWTLFVCVKGELVDVSDDLVNSFHLLLACCDFVYGNAIMAKRRDLLISGFAGLPSGFFKDDFTPPNVPPCIIDHLCTKHDGIPLEAKGIKEYCWKVHMRKLFNKKLIKGDLNNLSGILEAGNFEANFKSINKVYEEYVLSVGDFDERIFLAECRRVLVPGARGSRYVTKEFMRPILAQRNSQADDATSEIGTPAKGDDFDEKMQAKKNNSRQCSGIQTLAPPTPLTGRNYLKAKEHQSDVTPVSTATQSVSRLQAILTGRQNTPSETLKAIFASCVNDPLERVEERVRELGTMFSTRYTQTSEEHPGSHIDFARKRLTLAESLYYKLLENILVEEKKKKPELDFTPLLEQDIFHQTLFACSLEMVIYSYNSQRMFPWVLEALNLEPYYFYKVIEVIVRVEDQLSRDMVKHLNLIEEQILEVMGWRTDSPLWEAIRASGQSVPSCEEVCLPGQLEDNIMATGQYPNPAIRRLIGPGMSQVPQSPSTSASDRFQSPVPASAKKRTLYMDTASLRGSPIKPGQSLLQTPKTMSFNIRTLKGENGEQYVPVQYSGIPNAVVLQTQPTKKATQDKDAKPKRTGSLGLFFRKFYHLASVRMQDLCSHLNVVDGDIKRKIWTCFEHSIMQHTTLMQDRHLDQLLMCAVYVTSKAAQHELTFMEIMRCYRLQPQYASHVYRSVLLRSRRSGSGASSNASPTPSDGDNRDDRVRSSSVLPGGQSAPPTPTRLAGTSASFEFEDRGDLIKFYNTVYVQRVQAFALKFSARGQNENLTLSPLPLGKNQPMSPRGRRVSENHPVFIRTLEAYNASTSPAAPSPSQKLSYCFSRSPAKDLRAINTMIQVDARKVGKRLLVDDVADVDSPPVKVVAKKLQDIMGDRMVQTQE